MTSEIQIFNHPEFGEVSLLEGNGNILFCASDVARVLGYSNPRDAILRHCRCVVKRDVPHPQSNSKFLEVNFISEPDVYRLICGSKLESAERFERWVFEEVLPSIRKYGAYMTSETIEKTLTNPDFIIGLAQRLKDEQSKTKELQSRVEADKPKVLFADAVSTSQTDILVGDLAKILHQNGIDIGQKRLFEFLRNEGYLMKYGVSRNMPTQRSMELGIFRVKETTITKPDGSTLISHTVKVTGKGQVYFVSYFLKRKLALVA